MSIKKIIVFCVLAMLPIFIFANELSGADSIETQKTLIKKNYKNNKKVFYGFSAHLDVASPLVNYLIDKSMLSFEAAFDVDLMHKYFPTFELGFGSADKINENNIHYKVNAPFYRIGLNFNILRTKNKDGEKKIFIGSYPYIGFRYGFSLFKYDLEGVVINDDYWGVSRPMEVNPKYLYAGWAELVAGVKVNMVKGFTMGWNIRVGLLSHTSRASLKSQLWYIPGFGKNNTVNVMFNYTFGYTFNYDSNKIK